MGGVDVSRSTRYKGKDKVLTNRIAFVVGAVAFGEDDMCINKWARAGVVQSEHSFGIISSTEPHVRPDSSICPE